ncbi:MAG: ribulose-phosphate 3-epimerase [Oligoflexia bacterium]|nr:ribulose-phosphate 3-epimerase [Oligoflexia bacterium]
MALVAPSILSADFGQLAQEIVSVSSADWIHVDVMDGRFVPNITIGPPVVRAVHATRDAMAPHMIIDCHLMIVEPDRYIDAFADAGADVITVHAETCNHLDRTIQAIKARGVQAGVALNPHTSEHVLDYVLEECDLVLVMSVNPGFGGQSLIERVFPKIERIRSRLDAQGISAHLQVDGGVKTDNAWRLVKAGATVLVSGSGVFKSPDRTQAIAELAAARRPLV